MFSENEITYLKSQRIARIATASAQLQPDVAPVGFDFDGTYFLEN
jgi:pyridoxamine 5'-phosphate oxidase family protein